MDAWRSALPTNLPLKSHAPITDNFYIFLFFFFFLTLAISLREYFFTSECNAYISKYRREKFNLCRYSASMSVGDVQHRRAKDLKREINKLMAIEADIEANVLLYIQYRKFYLREILTRMILMNINKRRETHRLMYNKSLCSASVDPGAAEKKSIREMLLLYCCIIASLFRV